MIVTRNRLVQSVTSAALAGFVLAATAWSASAKPIEKARFHDGDSFVINNLCGDLQVGFEFHDDGSFVLRPTGPTGLPRYTASHHGGASYTNLATDKSFTVTWNYVNQDTKVTDNGNGTYTFLMQVPGPEKWFGPDGQLLNTSGGIFVLRVVMNDGGTPSDPSDDSFVSEDLVRDVGGKPQEPWNFCDSFRALTA